MKPETMIESIRIRGFRSLADVELLDLPRATVLIGANGSGKSNFIRFFEMLNAIGLRRLSDFVEMQGGADDQLYGGNRVTPQLDAEITFRNDQGRHGYQVELSYAHPDRFYFHREAFRHKPESSQTESHWDYIESGYRETALVQAAHLHDEPDDPRYIEHAQPASAIVDLLRNSAVYQFHDTSDRSDFKKLWDIEDNSRLRNNGGNLAAILHRLDREDTLRYELICRHISRILPGFDRFDIEGSYGKVALRWKAKWSEKSFGAHLTSDGSLRFFALVTLLNLPPEMLPDVVLLDEPELGLHPAAVSLVGGMIKSLSVDRQVFVATQSPLLVDTFGLSEIFVLDLNDGQTDIRPLKPDDYQIWLEDGYSTGDLWWKNLFGGYP